MWPDLGANVCHELVKGRGTSERKSQMVTNLETSDVYEIFVAEIEYFDSEKISLGGQNIDFLFTQ